MIWTNRTLGKMIDLVLRITAVQNVYGTRSKPKILTRSSK